jgi:hypothetical protein
MVTFGRGEGEVDWHTFSDTGTSHIDDGPIAAVPEATMPSFDGRGAGCVKGRWSGFRRDGSVADKGRETGEDVQVSYGADNAARNSGTTLVGDPAGIRVEVAYEIPTPIEAENGEEPHSG